MVMDGRGAAAGGVSFGDALRGLRKRAGFTQEELAERAGLSVRGIGDIERGVRRAPYRATICQLADALDLTADERSLLLHASRRWRGVHTLASRSVLPVPPSPLVGRQREIEVILRYLGRVDVRLLTLTGPGGVGKTRLALEVARLREDITPVSIVSLAPLRDPLMVAPTIARSLGVRETADQPVIDTLAAALHETATILVLDNLEHLLGAAGTVAALLAACPRLQILVTSRAPLHIQGEHEYPISPLEMPDSLTPLPTDSLLRYPAVELFVERAQAVRPDFQVDESNGVTVTEICRRLDGLPLAIELAAARIKVFSSSALLTQLRHGHQLLTGGPRDLPERLQTLHHAIAWSYDLLGPAEQTLFRRLSVFSGGCTAEAAEAVCANSGQFDLDVLEGLSSLVDKSLLRVHETRTETFAPRFSMLETVREFAHEQLMSTAEHETVRRQHALYFLSLVDKAHPHITGPDQLTWLDHLELEYDNLRAALRGAQRAGDITLGLQLAGRLWPFWLARGLFMEGQEWLHHFLNHPDSSGSPPGDLARALHAAGELAFEQRGNEAALQLFRRALVLARSAEDTECIAATVGWLGNTALSTGDYEQAARLLEESRTLYARLNEPAGMAAVLARQAALARYQGDYERAETLYEDSLTLGRELGDLRGVADVSARLGQLQADRGRLSQAVALYEEALVLYRRLGNTFGIADVLYRRGAAAADAADYTRAMAHFTESLELYRSLGNKYGIAYVLMNQGEAALRMGDLEAAKELDEQSLALFRELGDRRCVAHTLLLRGDVAREQRDYQHALSLYCESLVMNHELTIRPGVVMGLERMVRLAVRQGQWERAARLHRVAASLRATMDSSLPPADRADYDQDIDTIREQLGDEVFTAGQGEGRLLSLAEAVEYACSTASDG